jgi:Flp pilus assembly protein TadG
MRCWARRIGAHRGDERGVALVEFALFVPVLGMLTFGLIDLSRGFLVYEQVHNAAREAAVFASSHPGQLHNYAGTVCQSPGNAEWHGNIEDSQAFTYTFSSDVTSCVIDPSQLPASSAVGQPLRVTARTAMTTLTPLFGSHLTITATVCVNIGAGAPSNTACPA